MASFTNGQESESEEALAGQLASPTALRKLVLNYLIHHCYTDTAQAFAHDGISASSRQGAEPSAGEGSIKKLRKPKGAGIGAQLQPATPGSSHSRSWSRSTPHSAHPLSAPPLSREDSSMEIEVDNLLSLAGGRAEPSGAMNGAGTSGAAVVSGGEDTKMIGEGFESLREDVSTEELSLVELRSVRSRKEIKDHILCGRIKQAVDLCNTHFPAVLNSDAAGPSSASGTEQTRAVKESVRERDGPAASIDVLRVLPANPTSLYPAHLSLNLQIQAFIESVRSASTTSISNGLSAQSMTTAGNPLSANAAGLPHSVASNAPGITSAATVLSRSASPAPSSASSTGSGTSANGLSGSNHSNGSAAVLNPVLHAALSHAQLLYTNVQKLPAYWRAMYYKELESVTALLAYTDLERSPVRKYLDQSRRVALAEQINSAIMFRTGNPSQPLIESAVRQTSFLWFSLSSDQVVIPTDHAIFTSGTAVGLDHFETQSSGASGGNGAERGASRTKGKILPPWNLHSYLQER